MPVIRVTKTTNYTVISNYPLRDSRLSLKACALLCKMLCNADTWDYSITGMATQCKDGKSAVSNAMKELEQYGYLVRRQHRNERGQIVDTEYIIYESPELNEEYMRRQAEIVAAEPEASDESAEPKFFSASEEPSAENPFPDNAEPENDAQINTISTNTEKINTDAIKSYPSFTQQNTEEPAPMDVMGYEEARERVTENIEYEIMCERYPKERLDEIVDIASEALCTRRATFDLGKDVYPYSLVKDRLLRLNASHLEYIFTCLDNNTTEIRNIKPYLLKTLVNAPATMENYYTAKVNHDLYGSSEK